MRIPITVWRLNWRASSSIGGNPGGDDGLSLDDWRAQNFTVLELEDPAISGPAADPEGDLTTNLEEFLFGGDPNAVDSAEILPFVTVEEIADATYAVVNVRLRTAATGVTWQITSSVDLTAWDPAGLADLGTVDLGEGAALRRFRMNDPLPEPGPAVRLFRVEID